MKDYTFNGRYEASSSIYQQDKNYQRRSSNLANFNNSNNKNSFISETDKKIDQIKRKYDTPNRRQRFNQLSQISSNKKDSSINNYNGSHTSNFNDKQNFDQKKSVILAQSRNCLKESFAINRQNQIQHLKPSTNDRDFLLKQRMEQQYKYQRDSRAPYNQRQKQQRQNLYKNQTEQQFFSRVKKMKQSLFCPQTKRKDNLNNVNECTRSQYEPSKNSRTYSSSFKEQNFALNGHQSRPKQIQKDRIDNIDKINQKIKGILECLNQNEKVRASKYVDICNNQKKSKVQPYNYRSRQIERQSYSHQNNQNRNDYLKETTVSGQLKKSIQMPHLSTYSNENNSNSILHHRHKQSQLLQKIQIPRPTTIKSKINVQVQEKSKLNKNQKDAQEERWERISNKLSKYQLSNKGRFQKAFNRDSVQNEEDTNPKIQQSYKPRQRVNTTISQHNEEVRNAILQKYNRAQNPITSTPVPQKIERNNLSFFENSSNNNPRTYSVDPRERDHIRSRSFIGASDLKRDYSICGRIKTNENYQLNNGKKLNEQIDKIQLKIQQFQQQKKKLNMQFKPFTYSNTKSASNLNKFKYDLSQKKISEFGKQINTPFYQQSKKYGNNHTDLVKKQEEQKNNKQTFRVNEKEKNFSCNFGGDISFQNRYNQNNTEIEIKLQKNRNEEDSFKNKNKSQSLKNSQKTSKFVSQNSSKISMQQQQESFVQKSNEELLMDKNISQGNKKTSASNNNCQASGQLRKRTNEGIQDRKRRLMQNTEKREQTQIKQLVRVLCNQVKLDEQLRNGKLWLQNSSLSNKYETIKERLSERSIVKSIEQISSIFSVSESQNNPFFTTQDYKCSLKELIEVYIDSDEHWKEQILGKFDKSQLQRQGFDSHQIDLQRKGHIQLQDLVRFLNLNSGSFFRNRDVVLIFRRIHQFGQTKLPLNSKIKADSGQWIDFQWLLQAISKK